MSDKDESRIPLYAAQPAPVVSAELLHTAASAIEDLLTTKDRTGACVWFDLPFRLRSAANAQPVTVVPDGMERVATTLEHIGNFADAAIIRQLAANQQQNAQQNIPEIIPENCTWSFSSYDDHWSGTCGAEWVFNDGGPEENGVKFCPKCGKSVAVSAMEGTEE